MPKYNYKKHIIKAIILCLLSIQSAMGQSVQTNKSHSLTQNTSISKAPFTAKINDYITPYVQMHDLSGSILVSQNGVILYEKGVGYADIKSRKENTRTVRFRIGSLNKQITAAAILLLEEQGRLKTEDKLSKFFPQIPNADKITIQNLLTQTSGLPKYIPYKIVNYTMPSMNEAIKLISALKPEAEPGVKFIYSNAGFTTLAFIVEKASGQSFPQFIAQNIFKPLAMHNSGTLNPREATKLAQGYVTGVGTDIKPAPDAVGLNYEVYSTVEDLDKWQRGLYGGKLLSPASVNKMTTDYGNNYGYGLGVSKKPGNVYYGHDGVISGYTGFVQYYPTEKISIVYLGNIESGALSNLKRDIPAIVLGKEVKSPAIRPAVAKVSTANFQSYVGRYEVFPNFYIDVKRENDVLYLRGLLGDFIALTPLSDTEFFYRHLYASVKFVRDETGKVVRIDWTDPTGSVYPCKKISGDFPE